MLPYYRLGFMSFCTEDGGSRPCIPPKCWNCRQNYTASQPRTLIVIADVTVKATSHSGSAVSCSEFDAHRRPTHSAAGCLVWLTVLSKILFVNLDVRDLDLSWPHLNKIFSTFRDSFRRIGMRLRGWLVCFSQLLYCCAVHSVLSQAPSFIKRGTLLPCFMEIDPLPVS